MFSSRTQTYALLPNVEQKSEIVDFDPESEHAGAHTEATVSLIALRQAVVRNLLTTILAFHSVGISVILFATFVNLVKKENNCNTGPFPAWKEFARMYTFRMILLKEQCQHYVFNLDPDLDSIPIDYDQHVIFNGTLDFPSIYRGTPRPELDAAWNLATDCKLIALHVSFEKLEMTEQSPSGTTGHSTKRR